MNTTIMNVRADQLLLGSVMLSPDFQRNTVSLERVFSLKLVGDDVTVNETFTTSQNNLVTILMP